MGWQSCPVPRELGHGRTVPSKGLHRGSRVECPPLGVGSTCIEAGFRAGHNRAADSMRSTRRLGELVGGRQRSATLVSWTCGPSPPPPAITPTYSLSWRHRRVHIGRSASRPTGPRLACTATTSPFGASLIDTASPAALAVRREPVIGAVNLSGQIPCACPDGPGPANRSLGGCGARAFGLGFDFVPIGKSPPVRAGFPRTAEVVCSARAPALVDFLASALAFRGGGGATPPPPLVHSMVSSPSESPFLRFPRRVGLGMGFCRSTSRMPSVMAGGR